MKWERERERKRKGQKHYIYEEREKVIEKKETSKEIKKREKLYDR